MTDVLIYAPGFDLVRLAASETADRLGIDNSIPEDLWPRASRLSWMLYEIDKELQRQWATSLELTSAYRSPLLNIAVGGVQASMHKQALAADFKVPGVSPHAVAAFLAQRFAGQFDQIIQEYSWVHFGLAAFGDEPRGELLTATKNRVTGQLEVQYGLV
jgi:hypothetical protein